MFLTTALRYAVLAVVSRGQDVSGVRRLTGQLGRNLRRLGPVLAAVFVAMLTAVSTVSARGRSDLAALPAPVAGPGAIARAAAIPVAGTVFGGFTSQDWPAVLEVPTGGKRIARAGIGLDMKCTSGDQPSFIDAFANVRIAPSGNVNARRTIPPLAGSAITGGFDSLSGRFDHRRSNFSGAWQLHVDFRFSNGQVDHCDSGRVGFRARQ